MCRSMLQGVVMCCTVTHCVAELHIDLQCVAVRCIVLQFVACVAVRCSVLKDTPNAIGCSSVQVYRL